MSEPIKLWSVTTLIKLGMGTSDALVNWAVGTTVEAALDKRTIWEQMDRAEATDYLKRSRYTKTAQALARGTDIHRAAEARALGEEATVEVQNVPLLEQYDRFLTDFQPEFLMAEAPVYNPVAGYAGTLDAVARIDGRVVLLDMKTTAYGKDSGRTRPPYSEAALQLAAYRHATEVGVLSEQRYASGKRYYLYDAEAVHEPMPETDGALVLVVSPDDYMLVPVRSDEQVFRFFRHVIECARWQVSESRAAIGAPLQPNRQEVA